MIKQIDKEDKIKLNKTRRHILLKDVMDLCTEDQLKKLKKASIMKDGKKISFDEIDFNKDCLFITNSDLLPSISCLGLLNINHMDVRDSSLTGTQSRLLVSYMLATAADAKLAQVMNDLSDSDPDSWRLGNYSSKDLIIWNMSTYLGTGTEKDTNTISSSVSSIHAMRKFIGKRDWMFFTGTEKQFKDLFNIQIEDTYIVNTPIVKSNTSKEVDLF